MVDYEQMIKDIENNPVLNPEQKRRAIKDLQDFQRMEDDYEKLSSKEKEKYNQDIQDAFDQDINFSQ